MNRGIRFLVFAVCLSAPFEATAASFIAEYAVPSPAGRPAGIGSANGLIWFTEFGANKIASIDTQGVISEVALPTPGSGPEDVMPTPDAFGSLVFTEFNANKIGRISVEGKLIEVSLPTPNAGPRGLAAPSNFSIWVAEFNVDRIGIFNARGSRGPLDGTFSEFPLRPGSRPIGITVGPSGPSGTGCCASDMWFTEFGTNKIGRINSLGALVNEYSIPTPDSGPMGITGFQNGQFAPFAVWFTEYNANKIGRITADGQFKEIPIPTPDSGPSGISSEGGLWFTESRGNKIARVNPDDTITEFPLPTANAGPTAIFGTWFIESDANRVGRLGADWLVAVAAGHAGVWDTQFSLASAQDKPVTATVGLRPPRICAICIYQSESVTTPGLGTLRISASEIPTQEGFDTYTVTTQLSPSPDLPITRARIVNRSRPSQAADIPVLRFSTIRKLNPSVLTFPGAWRGAGVHSNLVLAEVSEEGAELTYLVEAYSAAGELVARSEPLSLGTSQTVELADVLALLGVSMLDGGQIRVSKLSGTGLLWGLLATAGDDGTLSTSPGTNP